MDSDERRRDLRARISLPTSILRRGIEDPATMLDASFRGLFLQMEEAPPVRQLIKLRITLPPKTVNEPRELVVHAVVVRIVDGQHGQPGVGLRFFALNGQDRSDWETFIASLIRSRTRAA